MFKDSIFDTLALKEMDSGALVLALQHSLADLESKDISRALDMAVFLHRNQLRRNRAGMPRTPYIEHPLRNTLRLVRWGCRDEQTFVASLLHDTIEDCALEMVVRYSGLQPATEENSPELREQALSILTNKFGTEVSGIVAKVSNDFLPAGLTKAEKRIRYAEHVVKTIDSYKPFCVKLTDVMDNAPSLKYTAEGTGNAAMVSHLALKYHLICQPLIDALDKHAAEQGGFLAASYDTILDQLTYTKELMQHYIDLGKKSETK